MDVNVKNRRAVMLILQFAAYLEKKGQNIGLEPFTFGTEELIARKAVLNQLSEEISQLNKDFDMAVSLIQRANTEMKKSNMPMTVAKKYQGLIIEKANRLDKRKAEILELTNTI
jgi:hypothetical protein